MAASKAGRAGAGAVDGDAAPAGAQHHRAAGSPVPAGSVLPGSIIGNAGLRRSACERA